jgi:hypothetical protein
MDLLMDKHQEFHHKAFKLHFLKGLAYPRWLSWPVNAANNAAEAARAATQASSSTSEKKRDLYHLIPRPATFSPSDRAQEVSLWRDWFWGLRQYLLFIDGKYEEDLEYVERSDVQEVDWDLLDEEEQHRGRFLYAGPVVELVEEHRQEQRSRGPETAGDELPT